MKDGGRWETEKGYVGWLETGVLDVSIEVTPAGVGCEVRRSFFWEVGVKKLSRDRFLDIVAFAFAFTFGFGK